MRTVVVSQAHFLPRLHQVKRLVDADVFVLMDDHQFGPHWQRRTLIKTPQGARYLTVPVKGGQRQHVRDVLVDNGQPWQEKVMRTLRHCYGRAPYFGELSRQLEPQLYGRESLYQINRLLLFWVMDLLDVRLEVVEQSGLGRFPERKTDLMVALTRAVGGDVYHCGKEATERFYEMRKFEQAGIRVWAQQWTCPEYPQLWGEFVPSISVVDALFNVGAEGTRGILEGKA
jgi:hypothetical protein